ncbi:hypothetical protein AURDEDRAFT_124053 [Auricularia subglabra TFB-10046 SS5]|nr:hypothetical protein AURDEDRAFT_124053 [Auricularia subglabra TFB-10046 SS5]
MNIRACTLPFSCPALSTLVDLRISELPKYITLQVHGGDTEPYDLIPHYLAWETGKMRRVFLCARFSTPTIPNLSAFLRDARTLNVSCDDPVGNTFVITSEHANSATHSIRLTEHYLPRLSGLVYVAKDALRNVHTFKLSDTVIEAFVPVLAVVDTLQHLLIQVLPREVPRSPAPTLDNREDYRPRRFAFDWEPLTTYLPRLRYFMLRLETVTVQVLRPHWDAESPAHAGDLRGLLTECARRLTLFSFGDDVQLEIQGFDEAAVRSVDPNTTLVRFNTSAKVEHLAPSDLPTPTCNPFPF